jgi:hypothetical protein
MDRERPKGAADRAKGPEAAPKKKSNDKQRNVESEIAKKKATRGSLDEIDQKYRDATPGAKK